jgi:hypothetical protein
MYGVTLQPLSHQSQDHRIYVLLLRRTLFHFSARIDSGLEVLLRSDPFQSVLSVPRMLLSTDGWSRYEKTSVNRLNESKDRILEFVVVDHVIAIDRLLCFSGCPIGITDSWQVTSKGLNT